MTTTLAESALQLRVLVGLRGRRPLAVELDAPPDATVGAAADALAEALGSEGGELRLDRTGEWLERTKLVAEAGLRHGDRLLLAPSREGALRNDNAVDRAGLELAVVGGPDSGRRFPLLPGDHVLGRDGSCAIALDDAALSGEHLRLTVTPDEPVTATDVGSRNGTLVEGEALTPGEPTPILPGTILRAGRSLFAIETGPPPVPSAKAAPNGIVPFNRPPRVHRPLDRTLRTVPAPPEAGARARMPLGASLVPLVLGVGLYLATKIPTMLFFSVLSPVMAASTYLEERRSGRKGFEERRRGFRKGLVQLREELETARVRELSLRRSAAPSADELLQRVRRIEPALWERRPADDDFLSLRIGTADRPSLLEVRVEPGGDAPLRTEVEELARWYSTAPAVPVELALREAGVAGLCGSDARVDALAHWLVAQAAALHSPRELVVAAALGETRLAGWEWLAWLPHTSSDASPLAGSLATGLLATRTLLEDVRRLVDERAEAVAGAFGAARRSTWTSVLLLLDETVAPERGLVAELLRGVADAGVAVLWLGRQRRDLPGECTAIIELDSAVARLSLTDARSGETIDDVSVDGLDAELAEELALAIAPVRDTSAARAEGAVPERAPFFDLLGVDDVTPEWVAERWDERRDDLSAVLGAGADGPFSVDLRRDGPHALVAGMTGAGKSELLQTLLASLAVTHPPRRLTFLLVDYKGGAAFKDCLQLPHTVGLVTDLDGHLTQRALASLNAELQRRERILRDAGAKDLADMERQAPDRSPASLAIVIDEFATLAKEVPEFVEGVVDVAQRGRSLGVHLILATQRPGGVVSENIRANTNLRIALRVNEAAESTDVIGVPDAARIPRARPGRAYARTGHGELTELQTAYVGAATQSGKAERTIRVRELGFATTVEGAPQQHERGETELRRLVSAAAEAAAARGLEQPASPWLPPLEPVVPLASLVVPSRPGTEAVLGVLDEPERQRQTPYVVDLEAEGSLLVYGSSGAGKTTFLRTLAVSLAGAAPPEDVQLYGLDFATHGLSVLAGLPHVGSVIAGEDEERTARLFAFLRATMERRKALFAERRVFTLSEHNRAASGDHQPRIVVLLDNYAGFVAAFERVNLGELVDALPRLVGDGRPLGVHFAITADRRGAVPNALAGIIPTKLVLRMADEDEYAALGVPPQVVRGANLPPGRAFLSGVGGELQVALAAVESTGEGQAGAIEDLAQRLRDLHPGRHAPAIEPLPVRVERRLLPSPERPSLAVLGVGDAELAPVVVDLSERHFLVLGPYRSGRSTALGTLAASLRSGSPELSLHLLAPRRSPLAALGIWTDVAEGVQACDDAALRLAQELEGVAAALIVIDDGEELAESLAAPSLETIVRRGRDSQVRVVAAAERHGAQRAFGGWLRELRKEEHGLLLSPDPDVDGDLLAVRLPRRSNAVYPPGRGYLVVRGELELVQVAAD